MIMSIFFLHQSRVGLVSQRYMSKRPCPVVVCHRFIKCSLFRLLHVISGIVSHRVLAFSPFEYEPPKSTRILVWNADWVTYTADCRLWRRFQRLDYEKTNSDISRREGFLPRYRTAASGPRDHGWLPGVQLF